MRNSSEESWSVLLVFPEVTHAEFVRRKLECIIGFDGEKI